VQGFVLKRLLQAPLVLLVLVTVVFFLVRLAPGGPFDGERDLDPAVELALNAKYHLDESLPMQYLRYLGGLVQGDLGPSYTVPDRSVAEIIALYLPASLWVGGIAMVLALAIGISAGTWAAVHHNRFTDHAAMLGALVGLSVPTFVIGPLLMLVLAVWLDWLPTAGWNGFWDPRYLVLPATTLAAPFAARIARLTRAGMLEVLNQDFVRTARAMGLPERNVVVGHALRGGLVPVLGFLGPAVAQVVTGSLVVEQIFQIPGLGREFIFAAINRDYTLVMGTVVVYGVMLVVLNLVTDLIHGWMDPRVRLS
jgi:oligopeptide transport system permease protein